MNENEWVKRLSVPLPEDVMKHKWHGDFAAAGRIIRRRLENEPVEAMRQRLLLEEKILKRLPGNYPLGWKDALKQLQAAVEDFQPEELQELMDADYADWIYIEGKPHFRDNLVANLFKTRADYAARRREKQPQESAESRFLKEALAQMRNEGGMERTIRLRSRLWLLPEEAAQEESAPGQEGGLQERRTGLRAGETVRVWLPLPGVDAQVKAVRILDDGVAHLPAGSVAQVRIAPETAGQRTIFWEAAWQPGMEFLVEYEYDVAAGYIDLWSGQDSCDSDRDGHDNGRGGQDGYDGGQDSYGGGQDGYGGGQDSHDSGQKQPGAAGGERIAAWRARYGCMDAVVEDDLGEQLPHIVFSPMLRALTSEVVGEETRSLEKARRIYDFVTTKIHYSYMRSYLTLPVIPEYVAAGHKGDCGAQALLFITMCRIAGIPARWQSGLYANPGRVGNHDWARFYIEEYGWLFADCSFGGGAHRAGEEERRRFYFGNLDPWRMPSCRRFQTDFEPPMERLRSDPYDAQSGEVELAGETHDRHPFASETVMICCR